MSKEISDAVGEAPAKKDKSAAELLQELCAAIASARASYDAAVADCDWVTMGKATESLASLTVLRVKQEQVVAREVEAAGRVAAEARLLGIRRAYGSVASEMDEDEKRIADLAEAIARLNNRYTKVAQLRTEALALSDRFGLEKPTLEFVVPPARREIATTLVLLQRSLLDHANAWPAPVEECEHKMRERRSYTEIKGTEGYDIITSVGLKPFPELTERQQAVVVQRKREAEDFRQQLAIAGTVPSEGSVSIGGSV
jgi:hypothetical protein